VDTQALDVLEQKVGQILERLKSLRTENDELRNAVQQWEARYQEISTKLEDITRERDELAGNQRDTAKEERVRHKVTELLSRLEAAQSLA
jgi:predicted nuclease with TOPRIM domain